MTKIKTAPPPKPLGRPKSFFDGDANPCPHCGSPVSIRHGVSSAGSARRRCKGCGKVWTLEPKRSIVSTAGACVLCHSQNTKRSRSDGHERGVCKACGKTWRLHSSGGAKGSLLHCPPHGDSRSVGNDSLDLPA